MMVESGEVTQKLDRGEQGGSGSIFQYGDIRNAIANGKESLEHLSQESIDVENDGEVETRQAIL